MSTDILILGITGWVILVDVLLAIAGFPTFSQRIRKRITERGWRGHLWHAFLIANLLNLYMHWRWKEYWFW